MYRLFYCNCHIVSISNCIAWYVTREVKFYQGKYMYVIWHTCLADNLEKKPVWIPVKLIDCIACGSLTN